MNYHQALDLFKKLDIKTKNGRNTVQEYQSIINEIYKDIDLYLERYSEQFLKAFTRATTYELDNEIVNFFICHFIENFENSELDEDKSVIVSMLFNQNKMLRLEYREELLNLKTQHDILLPKTNQLLKIYEVNNV